MNAYLQMIFSQIKTYSSFGEAHFFAHNVLAKQLYTTSIGIHSSQGTGQMPKWSSRKLLKTQKSQIHGSSSTIYVTNLDALSVWNAWTWASATTVEGCGSPMAHTRVQRSRSQRRTNSRIMQPCARPWSKGTCYWTVFSHNTVYKLLKILVRVQ